VSVTRPDRRQLLAWAQTEQSAAQVALAEARDKADRVRQSLDDLARARDAESGARDRTAAAERHAGRWLARLAERELDLHGRLKQLQLEVGHAEETLKLASQRVRTLEHLADAAASAEALDEARREQRRDDDRASWRSARGSDHVA